MIEESWLITFVEKAARRSGLALDIGANVGEWTSLLSTHFGGVVAVEPDRRAFGLLQASAGENVLCHHAAAMAFNGAVEILMRPNHQQTSVLEAHPIGAGDQGEAPIVERCGVNAVTLDYLLFVARQRFGDMQPMFIKVDVEGAEGDVMAGATDPAFRNAIWLIEIHDRQVEVGLQLERLGYDALEIIPHPMPKAHPNHFWVYAEPAHA